MADPLGGGEGGAAGARPEGQATSSFPLPPPFYKLYGPGQPSPPPPAPVQGPIQVYDRIFDLDEPLVNTKPNAMIRALPDGSIDYRSELQGLVRELLPLFLELLRTLMDAPEEYAAPLARVSTALAAAQHLVNMVRPPQALATLEYLLQLEVQDKQQQLRKLRDQVQSVDQVLLSAATELAGLEQQRAAQPGPMSTG